MKTFVSTVWLGRDRERVFVRAGRERFLDIEELRGSIEIRFPAAEEPEEVLIISRERSDSRQPEFNLGD